MTHLSADRSVFAMLAEAWRARALMPFIFSRSILIIYQKTVLGWLWLIIRPAIAVAVLTFVSRGLLGVTTGATPFLAFITVSFTLWLLFHRLVRHGTRSLTRARGMARRIPAPRILFVFGTLAPAIVETLVAATGALGVLAYFTLQGELAPVLNARIFAAPVALLLLVMMGLGLACILSVLNAMVADTALTINYATSVVMIATPVIYPLAAAPAGLKLALTYNPLSGVFELWRWAVVGTDAPSSTLLIVSVVGAALIFLGGLVFFRRFERAALDRL